MDTRNDYFLKQTILYGKKLHSCQEIHYIYGLVQDCVISIADALEIQQSGTKVLISKL